MAILQEKKLYNLIAPYNERSARRLPNPLLVNKGKPKTSLSIISQIHFENGILTKRTEPDSGMKLLVITKDIMERQSIFISTIISENQTSKLANTTVSIKNNSLLNDSSFKQNRSFQAITAPFDINMSNNNQSTSINSSKEKVLTPSRKKNNEDNDDLTTELYVPKAEVDKFDYLKYYFDSPSYIEDLAKIALNKQLLPLEEKEKMLSQHSINFSRDLANFEKGKTVI